MSYIFTAVKCDMGPNEVQRPEKHKITTKRFRGYRSFILRVNLFKDNQAS